MALLEISGDAADHLYREGSAKASFWETIFGSSLRAKRRTHVSARADGTRVFDVPLLAAGDQLLTEAMTWMSSSDGKVGCREAAAEIAAGRVRFCLVGLQPQGEAVASFVLRLEPVAGLAAPSPALTAAFGAWFAEQGPRIADETLIPFGFTPYAS